MSSLTTFIDCPALQTNINNVFPFGSCEPLPLSQFLFSDMNRASVLNQYMSPGNGKLRHVQLVYSRRVLEAEVGTTVNPNCAAVDKRGETSKTYDLDETKGVFVEKTYNIIDLARRCEANVDYFHRLIADLINGLDRRVESLLATKLAALVGGYSTYDRNIDSSNSAIVSNQKVVKTLTSAGALDQNAWQSIQQTARLNSYCAAPVVIGEYKIVQYFQSIGVGCCATTGIDFSKINASSPLVIPSYRLSNVLDPTNHNIFLTMAPGAALPVWYNRYEGDMNALNDESNYARVIVSPMTGIPYDIRFKRSCDDIVVEIFLAWDLFGAPDDMFENSDPLDGITWINKAIVTNP